MASCERQVIGDVAIDVAVVQIVISNSPLQLLFSRMRARSRLWQIRVTTSGSDEPRDFVSCFQQRQIDVAESMMST
jgi:hypothetical protein